MLVAVDSEGEVRRETAGDYETFDHGADIGVRGFGASAAEAFANAARALTSVVTDPEGVVAREQVEIELEDGDAELLLFAFLQSLVYEMATRGMLFGAVEVELEGPRLRARLGGERVDVGRHRPAVEVKGPTMTELAVRRGADGIWTAQCVVDV